MCSRNIMREYIRKIRPDYSESEINDATCICMAEIGYITDEDEICREVRKLLTGKYGNVRGYALTEIVHGLLVV